MWCHQESNRGHKDFQSFALPTELWHHCFFVFGCKGREIFYITKCFKEFLIEQLVGNVCFKNK